MSAEDSILISRRSLGIATALLTLGFGALIVLGALEYSIGWDDRGPEPGYFPFRIGLTVMAASVVTLVQAWLARADGTAAAITHAQARRVAAFVLPMVAFVAVANLLGMYVAMTAYLFGVMWWQGGYRWWPSLALAAGTAVVVYWMFDRWLKVPLGKGPIEAWLGIY